MSKYEYLIGIDPGRKTGFAVWDVSKQDFAEIHTLKIFHALIAVRNYADSHRVFVRIEDARKRKWFGPDSDAKQQGAGSIKRECSIWDETMNLLYVNYEMVHPIKGGTKIKQKPFNKITGWSKCTSYNARDAAMLVFQLKK